MVAEGGSTESTPGLGSGPGQKDSGTAFDLDDDIEPTEGTPVEDQHPQNERDNIEERGGGGPASAEIPTKEGQDPQR